MFESCRASTQQIDKIMGHKITKFSAFIEAKIREVGVKIEGAEFRFSMNGTPHLVVTLPNWEHRFSITYFASTDTWRSFYPYAIIGAEQRKKDLKSADAVVALFNELRTREKTDKTKE